jgi:hypothetical protein
MRTEPLLTSAARHSAKYPNARPSKIAELTRRDKTTAQLQAEIEAKRRANTPKARLAVIIGKLNALIGRT